MILLEEIKKFESAKDDFNSEPKYSLHKISTKLDAFEREALGDIFREELMKLRYMAKLEFHTGNIIQSKYAWSIARANWIEKIGIKLGVLSADTDFKP